MDLDDVFAEELNDEWWHPPKRRGDDFTQMRLANVSVVVPGEEAVQYRPSGDCEGCHRERVRVRKVDARRNAERFAANDDRPNIMLGG